MKRSKKNWFSGLTSAAHHVCGSSSTSNEIPDNIVAIMYKKPRILYKLVEKDVLCLFQKYIGWLTYVASAPNMPKNTVPTLVSSLNFIQISTINCNFCTGLWEKKLRILKFNKVDLEFRLKYWECCTIFLEFRCFIWLWKYFVQWSRHFVLSSLFFISMEHFVQKIKIQTCF